MTKPVVSRCVLNVVIETKAEDLRDWLALGAAIADMRREGWRMVEGTERDDGTFRFRLQRAWDLSPTLDEWRTRAAAAAMLLLRETDKGEAT